jgi:hypothetical protein
MPDATTDGTHGKSTPKVIEDHPWAERGSSVNLRKERSKCKKGAPGIPRMICVRHEEKELSEKKGGKVVVVRSEWIGRKPAEI